jgi:hypothetical protein
VGIEQTLEERGKRYGDFSVHAAIAQGLQTVMRRGPGWGRLSDPQAQALTVIADKIARILSGDPNYADNWHDICGYATLVEQRLVPAVNDIVEPTGAWRTWDPSIPLFGPGPKGTVVEAILRDGKRISRVTNWGRCLADPGAEVVRYRLEGDDE